MSNYIGIDYGRGTSNVCPKTGHRYGVINISSLHECIYDELEPYYSNEHGHDDDDFSEPLGHVLVNDGSYEAESAFDGSCLFLTKSPYYTRAVFCSPCAPGAGYLDNPHDDGVKTLCFGHDMFNDCKAPYPVYRVSDDSLVEVGDAASIPKLPEVTNE